MNEKTCAPKQEMRFIEKVMYRIQEVLEMAVDTGNNAKKIDATIFGIVEKESSEKQGEVNCDSDAIFHKLNMIAENVGVARDVLLKL
jgi:hypothetical protein